MSVVVVLETITQSFFHDDAMFAIDTSGPHCVQGGTENGTHDRRSDSLISTNECWGPPPRSYKTQTERNRVCPSVRFSMDGFTEIVPVIPDVLAKIPDVGPVWCFPESMEAFSACVKRTWRVRSDDGSGGREVRDYKKGDCVGKTKVR
jgi:hypothetical protein